MHEKRIYRQMVWISHREPDIMCLALDDCINLPQLIKDLIRYQLGLRNKVTVPMPQLCETLPEQKTISISFYREESELVDWLMQFDPRLRSTLIRSLVRESMGKVYIEAFLIKGKAEPETAAESPKPEHSKPVPRIADERKDISISQPEKQMVPVQQEERPVQEDKTTHEQMGDLISTLMGGTSWN